MRVIGIAGRAGAGKHAAAAAIAAVLNDNGYSVKLDSFARDIKRAVRGGDGLVDKELDRRTMQVLGAEARRNNPAGLVTGLASRNNFIIPDKTKTWDIADFLVIADIRDENELRFCREHGVVMFVGGSFEPLPGALADHPSEDLAKEFSALDEDFVIPKQPTPARLAAAAADLVRCNLPAFLKEKEGAANAS